MKFLQKWKIFQIFHRTWCCIRIIFGVFLWFWCHKIWHLLQIINFIPLAVMPLPHIQALPPFWYSWWFVSPFDKCKGYQFCTGQWNVLGIICGYMNDNNGKFKVDRQLRTPRSILKCHIDPLVVELWNDFFIRNPVNSEKLDI